MSQVATPVGTFRIVYRGSTVHLVDLLERGVAVAPLPEGVVPRRPPFPSGSPPDQLDGYFAGRRRSFDLTIEPLDGSAFDRSVWKALQKVPAGATITYGELARRAGHAGSARAVGGSMHRNPVPIIVPCHRVVGVEGTLNGFGLGLWRKRWLLDREGAWPIRSKSVEGPHGRGQRTLDEPSERPTTGGAAPKPRRARRAAQPA